MSSHRFSQAISEGDGISVIVDVADADGARAAASQGAEAVAIERAVADLRDVTELPVLWRTSGSPSEAALAGADALVITVESAGEDGVWLMRQHAEAVELGLDCVVEVRSEEELELALEQLDPEIFLLTASDIDDDVDPLDAVLELLPDVPAGKLAIARVDVSSRDEVLALERAGIDAVLVNDAKIAHLVGHQPFDV